MNRRGFLSLMGLGAVAPLIGLPKEVESVLLDPTLYRLPSERVADRVPIGLHAMTLEVLRSLKHNTRTVPWKWTEPMPEVQRLGDTYRIRTPETYQPFRPYQSRQPVMVADFRRQASCEADGGRELPVTSLHSVGAALAHHLRRYDRTGGGPMVFGRMQLIKEGDVQCVSVTDGQFAVRGLTYYHLEGDRMVLRFDTIAGSLRVQG